MFREIEIAVDFIVDVIKLRVPVKEVTMNGEEGLKKQLDNAISQYQLLTLWEMLLDSLTSEYAHNWFVNEPRRGRDFRFISTHPSSPNSVKLQVACVKSYINYWTLNLHNLHMKVYVDPDCVMAQIGDRDKPFIIDRYWGNDPKWHGLRAIIGGKKVPMKLFLETLDITLVKEKELKEEAVIESIDEFAGISVAGANTSRGIKREHHQSANLQIIPVVLKRAKVIALLNDQPLASSVDSVPNTVLIKGSQLSEFFFSDDQRKEDKFNLESIANIANMMTQSMNIFGPISQPMSSDQYQLLLRTATPQYRSSVEVFEANSNVIADVPSSPESLIALPVNLATDTETGAEGPTAMEIAFPDSVQTAATATATVTVSPNRDMSPELNTDTNPDVDEAQIVDTSEPM